MIVQSPITVSGVRAALVPLLFSSSNVHMFAVMQPPKRGVTHSTVAKEAIDLNRGEILIFFLYLEFSLRFVRWSRVPYRQRPNDGAERPPLETGSSCV